MKKKAHKILEEKDKKLDVLEGKLKNEKNEMKKKLKELNQELMKIEEIQQIMNNNLKQYENKNNKESISNFQYNAKGKISMLTQKGKNMSE